MVHTTTRPSTEVGRVCVGVVLGRNTVPGLPANVLKRLPSVTLLVWLFTRHTWQLRQCIACSL